MSINPNIRILDHSTSNMINGHTNYPARNINLNSTTNLINNNNYNNINTSYSVYSSNNTNLCSISNNQITKNNYNERDYKNINIQNDTANDFFNQLQNQLIAGKSLIDNKINNTNFSASYQINLNHTLSGQLINNQNNSDTKNLKNKAILIQPQKRISQQNSSYLSQNSHSKPINSNDNKQINCDKCEELAKQNKLLISLMKQQIQIAIKQYNQKFIKILKQQTRELNDLKKKYTNNEKNIIKIDKQIKIKKQQNFNFNLLNSQLSQKSNNNIRNQYEDNNRKQKSPTKLSITKSNRSVSPINNQQNMNLKNNNLHYTQTYTSINKQKLTMLSKQLSPAKISRKYSDNQHINYKKIIEEQSNTNLNISTVSQKIDNNINLMNNNLNKNDQINIKFNDFNNKISTIQDNLSNLIKGSNVNRLSKKLQILQKGYLNIFSSKLTKIKKQVQQFINKNQTNLNGLFKQIQLISSRNMANGNNNNNSNNNFNNNINSANANVNIISIGPMRAPNNNLSTTYNPNVYSYNNTFKTGINNDQNLSTFFSKIKTLSLQIKQIRQSLQTLQTKQFKYDNYSIDQISKIQQNLNKKVYNLQNIKSQIVIKIQQIQKYIQTCKKDKRQKQINKRTQLQEARSNSSNNLLRTTSFNVIQHKNYLNQTNNLIYQTKRNNPYSSYIIPIRQNQLQNQLFNNNQSLSKYTTGNTTQIYSKSKPKKDYYNNNNRKIIKNKFNQFYSDQNQQFYGQQSGFSSNKYHNDHNNQQQYQSDNNNNSRNLSQNQLSNHKQKNYINQQQNFQRSSEEQFQQQQQLQQDEFFYPDDSKINKNSNNNGRSMIQPYTLNYKIAFDQSKYSTYSNNNINYNNNNGTNNNSRVTNDNNMGKNNIKSYLPSQTISRFLQVIKLQHTNNMTRPLAILIDQTGYVKSAQNSSYIYDKNMDGFQFNNQQLQWLKNRGIIIL